MGQLGSAEHKPLASRAGNTLSACPWWEPLLAFVMFVGIAHASTSAR